MDRKENTLVSYSLDDATTNVLTTITEYPRHPSGLDIFEVNILLRRYYLVLCRNIYVVSGKIHFSGTHIYIVYQNILWVCCPSTKPSRRSGLVAGHQKTHWCVTDWMTLRGMY